ncbi:uncharacterized protein FA14DRAFT_67510 [Meira miltonrushii]|uniref:Uncharacterized protein n=1 Tax=Meira miltonrushii TaxID=1280837 RepID=A0A316V8Q1_9BASI|nr:uncharacterized protein FA14DRAFT_67510 [Meira miltonrushii]PWN33979.1 hypothetical protein FA14DRAFT_67510 [Meira miltonrushii]
MQSASASQIGSGKGVEGSRSGLSGKRQRSEETSPTSTKSGASDLRNSSSPRKRRKSSRNADQETLPKVEENINQIPVGLLDLPVELLQSIYLYAKNPNFPATNKHLFSTFSGSSVSFKAKYLLARWHEAYCYGFQPTVKQGSLRKSNSTEVNQRPPLPTTPSSDLLANGLLPELSWPSRFIPVLPTNDFPYPMSNAFHRSADHFILDYCLRYRLCDVTVLHAVEEIILHQKEFGNIAIATGLWRDHDGYLHPHEPRRNVSHVAARSDANDASSIYSARDDEMEAMDVHNALPAHLRITEIPKRLFQSLKAGSLSKEVSDTNPLPFNFREYVSDLDPDLAKHLSAFGGIDGNGPFPSHASLLLLLSIAAMHVPTTTALPSASAPFNSFEGLPLAKATFARSTFMVQLLLSLGAEPSRKASLSLYIAIRSGWLDGLIQLVERDEAKFIEWQSALDGIRDWFRKRENDQRGLKWKSSIFHALPQQVPTDAREGHRESSQVSASISTAMNGQPHRLPAPVSNVNSAQEAPSTHQQDGILYVTPTSSFKRRRLLDRANLDSKMLKEAVKHNNWSVANWLRSKGIVPDLRTIKLIEMKQSSGQIGGNLT